MRLKILGILSLIICISISMLSGCAVQNVIGSRSYASKADAYIEALNSITTDRRINGQVLVAKDGKILLNKGYGYADDEKKTRFSKETAFLIGSNTKPITAMAIMQLHEKRLLNVKDPVSKYIPNQTRGAEITIEQLMTHTSGLQRNAGIDFHKPIAKEALVAKITSQPLDFDPGTKYQYSNVGFSLLAYIIEQVSGQSYEDYVKKNIFEPAGMSSTQAVPSNSSLPDMPAGYSINDSVLKKVPDADKFDLSVFMGARNIYSTASDMYKLDRALYTEGILSQKTLSKMYKNAYGWSAYELNGHRYVGYNGLLENGYSSTFLRFIDDDLVVILLMNVSNQDNIGLNVGQVLAGMALGEEYSLPEKKDRISLSSEELKKFEGRYQLENGNIVTVKSGGGRITLEPVEVAGLTYVPYSENEFYAEGSEYKKLKFTTDQAGNINGIIVQECTTELKFDKLK